MNSLCPVVCLCFCHLATGKMNQIWATGGGPDRNETRNNGAWEEEWHQRTIDMIIKITCQALGSDGFISHLFVIQTVFPVKGCQTATVPQDFIVTPNSLFSLDAHNMRTLTPWLFHYRSNIVWVFDLNVSKSAMKWQHDSLLSAKREASKTPVSSLKELQASAAEMAQATHRVQLLYCRLVALHQTKLYGRVAKGRIASQLARRHVWDFEIHWMVLWLVKVKGIMETTVF